MEHIKNIVLDSKSAAEQSMRIKRQRLATEKIYAFAKEHEISLEENSVSIPATLTLDLDARHTANIKVYVILSEDKKWFLCWDMLQLQRLNPNTSIVEVKPHYKVFKVPNDGGNKISPLGCLEAARRGLNEQLIHLDYSFEFRRYYVLETLPMFDSQLERTALLEQYAYDKGLFLLKDAKAKISSHNDGMVWSLRCSRDRGGREIVYAICDRERTFFEIVDFCIPWVLQQRVASRKIATYLLEKSYLGSACSGTRKIISELKIKPTLARFNGDMVWYWYFAKNNNFIAVSIKSATVFEIAYNGLDTSDDCAVKQRKNEHFPVEFDSHHFMAMSWAEFIVTDEQKNADD